MLSQEILISWSCVCFHGMSLLPLPSSHAIVHFDISRVASITVISTPFRKYIVWQKYRLPAYFTCFVFKLMTNVYLLIPIDFVSLMLPCSIFYSGCI